MAKITYSPLVARLTGAIGNTMVRTLRGRGVFGKKTIPAKRKSNAQIQRQDAFARCIKLYRGLFTDAKSWLARYNHSRVRTGLNGFISNNLAHEIAGEPLEPMPYNPHCPCVKEPVSVYTWTSIIYIRWQRDVYHADERVAGWCRKKGTTEWKSQSTGYWWFFGYIVFWQLDRDTEYDIALAFYNTRTVVFGSSYTLTARTDP